jgi:hypothetical protein
LEFGKGGQCGGRIAGGAESNSARYRIVESFFFDRINRIVRIVGVHVRASNIVITSTGILKILLILSKNTPPPSPRTSVVKKQEWEFWDRLY